MNRGLLEASHEVVLFLDDDIIPHSGLVEAHTRALDKTGAGLVAGRVVQPWQEGVDFSNAPTFHFGTTKPVWITQFMGGNFSVRRHVALSLGGFDENFVSVAYNFEAEFAFRLLKEGYRIWFEPGACVQHLKVSTGGTRTFGEHLKTWRPDHSVGAYYCILRTWQGMASAQALLRRPLRAVASRHYLLRPWWVPIALIAEIRGLIWALWLACRGPTYVAERRCISNEL
jgi:GT2 family glycosyltransferase